MVPGGEADDPEWHPVQHFLGLTTFGANVFVAVRGDETLVAKHDERASGQQELYLVLEGAADFELSGDHVHAGRGTVVAVVDPTVTRSAVAVAPGTALLVVGRKRRPVFDDVERIPLRADSTRRQRVEHGTAW